ncbi:MAG: hypothetical protein K0U38_07640 [Epsilonproteobacteria bacterium]|nr:hypothetical protein [Campylobacterota bacterium]
MKLFFIWTILGAIAFSDINVMTSKQNRLISVSKEELANLYLGKIDTIKGIKAIPVDNKENYREFYQKVLKKTPEQLRAYWMREIHEGKRVPPKKMSSSEIKQAMSRNTNIIAYASESSNAKVLLTLK